MVEHLAVGGVAQLLDVAPHPGRTGVGVDLVVEADLAVPVGQPVALDQAVRHVDPEAVDAALAPEPQDVVELGDDVRVLPVQVGLGHVEDVQVPLAGGAVGLGDPGPPAAAEHRGPVVRGLLAVRAAALAEDVALALGAARAGGQRGPEPRVLAARVVGHEVDEHLQAQVVGGRDHRVGVGERAEARVDVAVVGHVVAGVVHRRDVERAQPHGIHAEVAQVRQAGGDAGQVAHAVAVGVGPGARVHLVDHGVAPPGGVGGVGLVHDHPRGGHGLGVGVSGQLGHRPHASVCRAASRNAPAGSYCSGSGRSGELGAGWVSSVLTSMCAARRK